MDRSIDGVGSAEYLWSRKQVIAILKVDKGLADEADGVQLMKPMPELDALLAKARANGIFGTKMRSVIKVANEKGISEVVAQQFAVGRQILAGGKKRLVFLLSRLNTAVHGYPPQNPFPSGLSP